MKGSGFDDLDRAALKLGSSLAVATSCGTQRVRRIIVFDHFRDPRDQVEHHGCLVYDPAVVTVSVFPVDET